MSDWIAAGSVVVALLTWVVSQVRDRRARKASHTADFLAQLLTNDALAEANLNVVMMIDAGEPIDPKALDRDTERHILRLLNYYEYVCSFYYEGVLDKKLVNELRGGPMRRAFRVLEGVIAAWRDQANAPKLFEYLERYARQ